jgi:hypothetical protein
MPSLLRNRTVIERPIYASRLYARRAVDLRAQLLAEGSRAVVHGRTFDLSRSGAGVTLSRELASGTGVALCLRLPGCAQPLCLRAVVRRRCGFRVGLEFLDLTAEQRLLLCQFCYS